MLHMQLLVCGSKMESRSHPRIEIGDEEAMGSLESVKKARRKSYFKFPLCWGIDGSGFSEPVGRTWYPQGAVEKLMLVPGKRGKVSSTPAIPVTLKDFMVG